MHTIVKKMSFITIAIYCAIASLKLAIGFYFNSSAFQADGFNNFTDVIASVAIFIGLHIAHLPADDEHRYGHWKAEGIASLVASFIMFYIGIQVLLSAFSRMVTPNRELLDFSLVIAGFFSSVIFFALYRINKKTAQQYSSIGLKATAQNNLTDAITSFLSTITIILINSLNWFWLDGLIATIISMVILKTGLDIFKETVFQLSDGFDEKTLNRYKTIILAHPEIISIRQLKARHYGPNVYVDVTVLMDGNLTVHESHIITEDIERELQNSGVLFTDVHVEPSETF